MQTKANGQAAHGKSLGAVFTGEAHGDRDQWADAERGAGENHRLDSQGLASPQPLPGGAQLLGRHHR